MRVFLKFTQKCKIIYNNLLSKFHGKLMITMLIILFSSSLNLSFAILPIQHWQTPEGAKVYYIYAKEIPMLDLRVTVDAGAFREDKDYGLAGLTARLLTMGAADLDEESFAVALDDLGSSIGVSAGNDTSTLSLRSLNDADILMPSLEILKKMLTKPHFDPNILKREIDNTLVGLEGVDEDQSAIASEALMHILYPDNALSTDSKMLTQSLPLLTQTKLQQFFTRFYHANNSIIILVGDIDLALAQQISSEISTLLGKSSIEKLTYSFKISEDKAVNLKIDFNSPQSNVSLSHVGIERMHPDYLALSLGNHILGSSGLNSRLSKEIREKRGLTYSIYSNFSAGRYQGPFTIGFSTKNESVDEAIALAKEELIKFIENGPTAEELTLSKNNIIGGFALGLDSNRKLASALLSMGMYDLPLDYYESYQEQIKAISADDIKAAFKKHVHPDKLNIVVVGGENIGGAK
ncbi:peptidase M16 [Gammaproteobacteria bacterium]|nr:peptidase M16 [Gammaproteobacteria bacterium]